jgi:hypothetical protein
MQDTKEMQYEHVTDEGKRYNVIHNEQGHEIRLYESGAEYNMHTKRLEKPLITSANAVQMQAASVNKRRENKLAAARRGAIRGASSVSPRPVADQYDVIEVITEKQTELALAPEARGSVQAAKLVFQMLDAMPDRRQASVKMQDGDQSIEFSGVAPGDIAALLDAVRTRRRTLDGERGGQ